MFMDKDNMGKTIFSLWSLGDTESLEYMGKKGNRVIRIKGETWENRINMRIRENLGK